MKTISRISGLLSLTFFVFTLVGQTNLNAQNAQSTQSVEEYKAENDGWLVLLEEAYAQSKQTGKPILANFTGSDWCGWCKKLTKSVFVHKEFQTWAKENVILLELDFPRRKQIPQEIRQQNQGLKNAFGIGGFPTIWVFNLDKDDQGKYTIDPFGRTGYTKTVNEFTSGVEAMFEKKKNSSGEE